MALDDADRPRVAVGINDAIRRDAGMPIHAYIGRPEVAA